VEIRIGDVCKINAKTISKQNMSTSFSYLDTGSITENVISGIQKFIKFEHMPSRARRVVSKDTIIYSMVRPIQKHYGFIAEDTAMIVSTGFVTIDVKDIEKLDAKYLYFRLTEQHITEYLHNIAKNNASSYPSLNPEDLEDLIFDVPDNLSEQKRIAALLTEFELRKNLSIKISQKTKQILERVYNSLFIERHVQTTDFILRNYGHNIKESNITVSKLGDIASIAKKTLSTKDYGKELFWHYSIPAFDAEGHPELTLGIEIASNKFVIDSSCIMVSKLNPEFERIWTVIDPRPNSICSTEFVALLPKSPEYFSFLNCMTRSSDFHQYMVAFATGSTGSRQRFTPEDILSIQFSDIDINLIMAFNNFAFPLLKQINTASDAQHNLSKFIQENHTFLIENVA
jgi:type I restriction enzyme S subunit